jgi:tripeptide aminopeptidase
VEILEGIRSVQRAGIPHRSVEIVFSVAEEVYGKGASVLDYDRIQAETAYVLDLSGPVGSAAIQAPSILSFQVSVKGKAAHAGFAPEDGVNAIALTSQAISRITQGHIDADTTLNIGTISGGSSTNIVSESCVCRGEVRSWNHQKAQKAVDEINQIFSEVVEKNGGTYEMQVEVHLKAYHVPETDFAVEQFQCACANLGLKGDVVSTFGGSDNNQFVDHGLHGIVLSCGMYEVHSIHEYTTAQDLVMGARLIAELITMSEKP